MVWILIKFRIGGQLNEFYFCLCRKNITHILREAQIECISKNKKSSSQRPGTQKT